MKCSPYKPDFFWLHIKKAGGQSTRRLLAPYYKCVERNKRPECFIQNQPEYYNDILNNFRIPLGTYQLRRSLFAKRFLYPETWEELYRFAFVREPIDRAVSMFFHLFWRHPRNASTEKKIVHFLLHPRKFLSKPYAFDWFLERIEAVRCMEGVYSIRDLHILTHTAPVWDDVTDESGKVILCNLFRLENLEEKVARVFRECGLPSAQTSETLRVNKKPDHCFYEPTPGQKKQIANLFPKDFDLYQAAE